MDRPLPTFLYPSLISWANFFLLWKKLHIPEYMKSAQKRHCCFSDWSLIQTLTEISFSQPPRELEWWSYSTVKRVSVWQRCSNHDTEQNMLKLVLVWFVDTTLALHFFLTIITTDLFKANDKRRNANYWEKKNKYWSSGIYLMWLLDSVARFFFIQLIYFCLIVCSIIFHVLTIFLGYCLPIPMDNLNIINNTLGKKETFNLRWKRLFNSM